MNGNGQPESSSEALYEKHSAQLLLYGRALGLSHAEAEDVLHEVFVGLLGLAEPPLRPENYLVRAVRNRALNYRRSFFRRLAREFESARWFESAPDESPAERAAMRCLEHLPTEQRETIVLKVWHELTFEEIGELLSVSPHTAAGRYRYGLQKLRACLSQDGAPHAYEIDRSLDDRTELLEATTAFRGT